VAKQQAVMSYKAIFNCNYSIQNLNQRVINMGILNILIKEKAPNLLLTGIAGLAAVLASSPAYSIEQTPLFLQQGVAPNIMLLLDNSASMNKEVLLSTTGDCPSKCYLDFTPLNFFGAVNRNKQLNLCPGYNTLMYNPAKTYTHWRGKNQDGKPYQDAKVDSALENPYLTHANNSCTAGNGYKKKYTNDGVCNLTKEMGANGEGAYYYAWNDKDNDGQYDVNECLLNKKILVKNMSKAEQTNFANWFSYYRKREYVMKFALSEIISESQDRIGIAVINPNKDDDEDFLSKNEQFGTEVTSMAVSKNKKTLLKNLFRIKTHGSTPLRQALDNVGHYFDQTDSDTGENLFGFKPDNGSPILSKAKGGECQQNFVVALSDGYWNGLSPAVGNADGNSSSIYDGQSYGDTYSNTLADVAMHYYEKDLSYLNNPKTSALSTKRDNNPAQHLVTYTVSFGLTGTIPTSNTGGICNPPKPDTSATKQGWPKNCSDPSYKGSGWPEPIEDTATTIDDMQHAAWNGRGDFLSATNPQTLIKKLKEAITDIEERSDTAAATAISFNSTNMRSGGYIYQAGFDPDAWSGQLFAYKLTGNKVSSTPTWKAHKQLSALADPSDSRVIITYNGHSGIPFSIDSFPADYKKPDIINGEMHLDQVNDLLTNFTTNGNANALNKYAKSIIEYIRGDSSNEKTNGGIFRSRNNKLLADIIHSAPVYVGSPNPAIYPDNIEETQSIKNSYYSWATNANNISRTPMIYVGANDGGLHGFNAKTGAEEFVYIPKLIFSNDTHAGLHWLADPAYTHRYYVDQTPVINNVFIDKAWKTVLVSGLRGGGKGLFALDVTTPSDFSNETDAAKKVLWEFTDNNLGYTFSQPTLAKLNNGDWAAIFGNGYDNGATGDGKAHLFMIKLSDGSLIKSINTGAGAVKDNDCSDKKSRCNGLSTPAVVDLNGDGIADRAYAGDLQGNLWAFDLSSTNKDKWSKNLLFKAEISSKPQPITSRPAVTLHPHQQRLATAPNTMVFFGTGQYINHKDINNSDTQSFYGIWDDGSNTPTYRNNLVKQQILTDTSIPNNIRVMSDNAVNYSTTAPVIRGWYLDFDSKTAEKKERIIADPIIFGELVAFTTTIPDHNLCGIAGGSWLMVLDSNSGGQPNFTALDKNRDGLFNEKDIVSINGTDNNISGVRSGDLYWQPSIIQTGAGNSGTIYLPKNGKPTKDGATGSTNNDHLDQIDIQGMISSKARSSWSRFNF